MRQPIYTLLLLFIMFTCPGYAQEEQDSIQEELVLITQQERVSYSLGITIGNSFRKQGLTALDYHIFMRALRDVMKGKDLIVNPAQAEKVIQRYFLELQSKQYQEKIKKERAFLDENAQKEKIELLPSGLQYKVVRPGTGPKPRITDKVTVHYHMSLRDDGIIESTVDKGEPKSFRVNEPIKGITEALLNMPVGAKWQLFIPYDLAFGKTGNEKAPPYSTVVCVLELQSID